VKAFRRLFLGGVILAIAWLSHQPSLKPPFQLFPHQDKVFHFLEFAGLGLALHVNRDLKALSRVGPRLLAGLGWAALDEIHQRFVPGRFCDLADFLADAAGLLASLALFGYLYVHRKVRDKQSRVLRTDA
jgi:VanZ family protein